MNTLKPAARTRIRHSRERGNPVVITFLSVTAKRLSVVSGQLAKSVFGLFLTMGLGATSPALHAKDLGRLFLTPEQRIQLERLRHAPLPIVEETVPVPEPPAIVDSELPPPVNELGADQMLPEAPPPNVPPITVNGVVLRSNGQATAWVNGENTYDGDFSADNIRVERPQGKFVPIITPEHLPNVRLKPGQTYDPSTNTIVDIGYPASP